mgnify:CR=1 FL=1
MESIDIHHQENLAVFSCKDEILTALNTSQILLCFGETGSGKSTQLPQIIDSLNINQKLICIVKENISSTINSAEYVALQKNTILGQEIGLRTTIHNKISIKSKIIYKTYETILNEYILDRKLSKYSTIILDDVHVQSLHIKLLSEILLKICQSRIDFKLIITSIPYNIESLQQYYNNAISIYIPESIFPIDIFHAKMKKLKVSPENNSYIQGALNIIKKIHERYDIGNILVYLPSLNDVNILYTLLLQCISDWKLSNRELYIYKYLPNINNKEINEIYQPLPIKYTTIAPTSTTTSSNTNSNNTTPTTSASQYRVLMRKCILTAEVPDSEIHVPYIRYSVDSGYTLHTVCSSSGSMYSEQEVIVPITQVCICVLHCII